MKICKVIVSVCILVILISIPAAAEPGDLLYDLQKPNHSAYDWFGREVAAMGNNVLVSAPFDDTAGSGAGAAYLYDGATGNLLQTFFNPTPTGSSEYFGRGLASIGNYALVGDIDDSTYDQQGGSVYMFNASSGNLVRTFQNPTPRTSDPDNYGLSDGFGQAITAIGNNILVGAWKDSDESGVQRAGAAYLFDRENGELLHTLISPTPGIQYSFGYSLAEVGDNIVVGAPMADSSEFNTAGEVYMFDSSTYELLHTWTNLHPRNNGLFGWTVASFGDDVLIGGGDRAYLYDSDTGDLLLELGEELEAGKIVRAMVSAYGDDILVGAAFDDEDGTNDSFILSILLVDNRTTEKIG